MHRRVEIVGVLGVGKTTFLQTCEKHFTQTPVAYVFENSSLIADEIQFWLQNRKHRTYFIQTTFYQYAAKEIQLVTSDNLRISDFSLLGHHFIYSIAFHRMGLLQNVELKMLESLLNTLDSQLPRLVGVVYCHASISTIIRRIRERGRIAELSNDEKFISLLVDSLQDFLSNLTVPILEINVEHFNPADANLPLEFGSFISNIVEKG